jgi:hypothetical protein
MPLYIKKQGVQSTDYAMQSENGSGLNWTIWPVTAHVMMSSTWNFLDGEQISENEFMEAYEEAMSILSRSLPVFA